MKVVVSLVVGILVCGSVCFAAVFIPLALGALVDRLFHVLDPWDDSTGSYWVIGFLVIVFLVVSSFVGPWVLGW